MKTKKQLAPCPGMAQGLKRRLNKMIKHHMVLMVFHSRDALLQLPSVTLVMHSEADADYISGKFWFQYADKRYKVFLNIIKKEHFEAYNDPLPLMFMYTNCSKKHLLYTEAPDSWEKAFQPYADSFKTGHTHNINRWFKENAFLYEEQYTHKLLPLLTKKKETETALQLMQQLLNEALHVLQKVLFHSYDELFTHKEVVLDFALKYGSFAQQFFETAGKEQHYKRLLRMLEGSSYHYSGCRYEGESSLEKRRESLELFLRMTYTGIPQQYVLQLKKVQQRRYKKAQQGVRACGSGTIITSGEISATD